MPGGTTIQTPTGAGTRKLYMPYKHSLLYTIIHTLQDLDYNNPFSQLSGVHIHYSKVYFSDNLLPCLPNWPSAPLRCLAGAARPCLDLVVCSDKFLAYRPPAMILMSTPPTFTWFLNIYFFPLLKTRAASASRGCVRDCCITCQGH